MNGIQLPLAVQLRDSASFESFFAGPNREAVDALQGLPGPVLVHGAAGSGRTHLLQAVARSRRCPYLPLGELLAHGAEILDGYGAALALCLDDVDAVCVERSWCVSLLRLLDALRARGAGIALSASAPPDRMSVALPDLRTRLQACAVFGLKPLSDDERRQLLRERARGRGLELPEEVARWILHTQARDTGALVEALDRLDRASLSAKRRLTLPFVQSVLAS